MADTSGIKAGRAYIELGVGDKLTSGLKHAQARLKAFGVGVRNVGLGVAGLGLSIASPMVTAAKSFADSGAQLWDMSKRTGIAVEALSELDYMAAQTGSSLEGVERGVRIMQKSIMGAAAAVKLSRSVVAALGECWQPPSDRGCGCPILFNACIQAGIRPVKAGAAPVTVYASNFRKKPLSTLLKLRGFGASSFMAEPSRRKRRPLLPL